MRLHISIEDEVVAELDRRVGPRERSAYIGAVLRAALEDRRRWDQIEHALGAIGEDHAWDEDSAGWVRAQRRTSERRVG